MRLSRTCLRAALRQLESERLMRVLANRGPIAPPLNAYDIMVILVDVANSRLRISGDIAAMRNQ